MIRVPAPRHADGVTPAFIVLALDFAEAERRVSSARSRMNDLGCETPDVQEGCEGDQDWHIETPCWKQAVMRGDGCEALDSAAWCGNCRANHATYKRRCELRAQRNGKKRRLLNAYLRMRAAA